MTFSIDLDPNSNSSLVIKLFRNVENTTELRQKLLSGDLKCCIIKASLIVDPFQIVVAANKAVVADKITTKSVYTEILFNLSISKNITQSLQKFGIDDKDTDIVVAVVRQGEEEIEDVFSKVQGRECDLKELADVLDESAVKKCYKISDAERKDVPLLDSVITRIATKDFVSH